MVTCAEAAGAQLGPPQWAPGCAESLGTSLEVKDPLTFPAPSQGAQRQSTSFPHPPGDPPGASSRLTSCCNVIGSECCGEGPQPVHRLDSPRPCPPCQSHHPNSWCFVGQADFVPGPCMFSKPAEFPQNNLVFPSRPPLHVEVSESCWAGGSHPVTSPVHDLVSLQRLPQFPVSVGASQPTLRGQSGNYLLPPRPSAKQLPTGVGEPQ